MILTNRFSKPASWPLKLGLVIVAVAVLPLAAKAVSDNGQAIVTSPSAPASSPAKTDAPDEEKKTRGDTGGTASNYFIGRLYRTIGKQNRLAQAIELPAQFEASRQVSLYSKVVGFVQKVHSHLGDRVKEGQVLAELDAPEMEAEVQRLENMVTKSEADLARRHAELAQTEARRAELEALLRLRRLEFDKTKALVDGGAVKTEKLAEARFALESVSASQKKADDADIAAAKALVVAAEADIDVAKAELRKALAMQSYLKIRAPFDGFISGRRAVPGSLAQPPSQKADTALFEMVRIDPIRVVFYVPAVDIAKVTKDMPVIIRMPPRDGRQLPVKIARVGATLDPASRMLRVEIDLPNPEEKLRPGMFATVVIPAEADGDSGAFKPRFARTLRNGGQAGVKRLALSPDSKVVAIVAEAASGNSFEVELWDSKSGRVLARIKSRGSASSIVFSQDGHRVGVYIRDREGVTVFDVSTGKLLERTSAEEWSRADHRKSPADESSRVNRFDE